MSANVAMMPSLRGKKSTARSSSRLRQRSQWRQWLKIDINGFNTLHETRMERSNCIRVGVHSCISLANRSVLVIPTVIAHVFEEIEVVGDLAHAEVDLGRAAFGRRILLLAFLRLSVHLFFDCDREMLEFAPILIRLVLDQLVDCRSFLSNHRPTPVELERIRLHQFEVFEEGIDSSVLIPTERPSFMVLQANQIGTMKRECVRIALRTDSE
mmetsp:Transcript_10153/g.27835  ORF Transcript_10153/g.27835 Transcript_10153/m.27835 type:complete len:212 (+) Transcript_10153:987-1622(+)